MQIHSTPGLLLAVLLLLPACVDRTRAATDSTPGQAQGSRPGSRPSSRPSSQPSSRPSSRPSRSRPASRGDGEGAAIPATDGFARLLQDAVRGGRVDYAAVRRHEKRLDGYLAGVAKASLAGASKAEKLAFYINAYNAWTLRLVLDRVLGKGENGEDLYGVLKADGFFERPDTRVAGQELSLNALEKLGRELGDPRIHFAVNCASTSCPPLQPVPWSAAKLEAMLESATKDYFASAHGARIVDGEARVTQLLNWYAADFGGASGARNFVLRYAPQKIRDVLAPELGFLEYDWSLNDVRE